MTCIETEYFSLRVTPVLRGMMKEKVMKQASWGEMIPPKSLSMYLENVHGHVSDMTGPFVFISNEVANSG